MTRSLRELKTGSAVLCVMSLMAATCVVPKANAQNSADISIYRGNSQRTGFATGTLSLPISVIWQNTTEASDDVRSGPVSDNGVLFYGTGHTVYAVGENDGAIKWQYPPASSQDGSDIQKPGQFESPACVADGKVFIGNDDGYLYALDEQTGEDTFQVKTGGPIRSAPVVDGGVVYFGSEDGKLYDILESTQKPAWGGNFGTRGPVLGPAVVTSDEVIFADTNDDIFASAKSTGRLLWQFNAQNGVVDSSPLVVAGTVVFGSDKNLIGLSSHNGQQVWIAPLPTVITDEPASNADGTVFYVPTADSYLNAVNTRGHIYWRSRIDGKPASGASVVGNSVIIAVKSGAVYSFDPSNGAIQWSYNLHSINPPGGQKQFRNGFLSTSPLVCSGSVYTLTNDSTLTAFSSKGIDQLQPDATVEYPTEQYTYPGSQISYTVYLTDLGSGIDPNSVVLKVDGKIIPTDYSVGTELVTVKQVSAGQLLGSTPVKLATLTTGKHVLTLTASDWRGNKLTKTWRFATDSKLNPATASLPASNNSGAYATQSGTDAEFSGSNASGGAADNSGGNQGSSGANSGGSGAGSGSPGAPGGSGQAGGGGTPTPIPTPVPSPQPPPAAPPGTSGGGNNGGFPPPPPI